MQRDASICPHCGSESKPWSFHAGVWWVQSGAGAWQWLDPKANVWWWFADGTPASPSTTSLTPSIVIDRSVTSPPEVAAPYKTGDAGAKLAPTEVETEPALARDSSVATSAELERLANLHTRGVLTDEEFRLAKARLLGSS
jgi:hypothetical protein